MYRFSISYLAIAVCFILTYTITDTRLMIIGYILDTIFLLTLMYVNYIEYKSERKDKLE